MLRYSEKVMLKSIFLQGIVVHAFKSSSWEAKVVSSRPSRATQREFVLKLLFNYTIGFNV